jgi:ATP-dependent RNA helicase DeaD
MTDINGAVPAIAKALSKRGYESLTPVQQAMLDPALATSDALVSAQTGSGKTVAFGIAMASTLLDGDDRLPAAGEPLALVIAPTRELALQVKRELDWLYEMTGAVITSCVGGMDIRTERRALERGAHIVVGTPGRICDHIRRNALRMTEMRVVVLDEADEMLDLGFREDLEYILEEAPADRRTLMFSATVPAAIAKLAKVYQRDAVRISTQAETKQHGDIDYRALLVTPHDRENAIVNTLRFYEAANAIVFCSTRAAVNHLMARLTNRNFSVVALSGELTQNERTHALQAMRDGRARVCIATDVAARGIDLPGLELVIHADLPTNSETLLHRSGRTGRAGRKGVSALIVPVNQRRKAERLLLGAKIEPTWANPPSADQVISRDEERLLADPVFEEAPREDETDLIARLVASHGAEKLAAAFVSLYRGRHAAPEDITEVSLQNSAVRKERGNAGDAVGQKPPRSEFGPSVWFSLSVGRKQRAEPRWLIPMLCRNGQMTRHEIGAIKMQMDETFVEISEGHADTFFGGLGPDGALERGIKVTRVEGMPDFSRGAHNGEFVEYEGPRLDRPERGKPAGARSRDDRPKSDKPYAPRPQSARDGDDRGWQKKKPARAEGGAAPDRDMRREDAAVWDNGPARSDAPRRDDRPKGKPKAKPYGAADGGKPFARPGKPKTGFKPGPKPGKRG